MTDQTALSNLSMTTISETDFVSVAKYEFCRANLDERRQAKIPIYFKLSISVGELFRQKIFPTWRTDLQAKGLINSYETDKDVAHPITYLDLASKTHLFEEIKFDKNRDYFTTNQIVVFLCQRCSVYVVKDGNHRLLQCAFHKQLNRFLEIFGVASHDWSDAKIDMKNFCQCD
jgi:hypothetical protein